MPETQLPPTPQTPAANPDGAEASQVSASPHARPWYKHLSIQILLAMVLGTIVGHAWPERADSWKPLGDLFIKLVRMLVAPIIFCTVVHGIASVGEAKKVGRIAVKSLIYFRTGDDDRSHPGLASRQPLGTRRRYARGSEDSRRYRCEGACQDRSPSVNFC